MKKASEYIFNALPAQSSPYSVAISSYALALTKKYEWKDKLLKELDRTSTGNIFSANVSVSFIHCFLQLSLKAILLCSLKYTESTKH